MLSAELIVRLLLPRAWTISSPVPLVIVPPVIVEEPLDELASIPPDWIVLRPDSTAVTGALKRSEFVVKPAGIPPPVVTSVFTPAAYTSVPKDVSATMLEPLLVTHEEEFAV